MVWQCHPRITMPCHERDQIWIQTGEVSYVLINFLRIFIRCYCVASAQKFIADNAGLSSPSRQHNLNLVQFRLREVLWSIICQEMDHCWPEWTMAPLQNNTTFDFHPIRPSLTYQNFHLSNLLQVPNNCGVIDVAFLSSFSCCCKWAIFGQRPQFTTVKFRWSVVTFFIFRTINFFTELMKHYSIVCP